MNGLDFIYQQVCLWRLINVSAYRWYIWTT